MSSPEECATANDEFVARLDPSNLPRNGPGRRAVVTCMDPRINLEAIFIPRFGPDGSGDSTVTIIRALGGRSEDRSILVDLFLAGVDEVVIMARTECGCARPRGETGSIKRRTEEQLDPEDLAALIDEVAAVEALPFVPSNVINHGLIHDVNTGQTEVVADGSAGRSALTQRAERGCCRRGCR